MKQKKVTGTIDSAYGTKLATSLKYETVADQFENVAEVKAANEWPKDDTVVTMVNARKVAAKRQEAIKATLDAAGIVAPTLEDISVAIRETAKILLAQKKAATQEEAEAKARLILGVEDSE